MMLVTDHSGSMAATDVQPTRLAAAERAANTFIDQLPEQRAGRRGRLLGLARRASRRRSTDHGAARAIIDAQIANGATATGDALQLALQLLHGGDKKHPPSAIVLLSDGAANAGVDVDDGRAAGGQRQDPDRHRRARHAERRPAQPRPVRAAGRRFRPIRS